jgi:uroporphyrinogen decarboxylase
VQEFHSIILERALRNVKTLLPEVRKYVDIVGIDADDWGNQNALMAPPHVYRDLFLPFRKRHCDAIHAVAPEMKTFLHSCGAIYDILDMLVESGIDVINPIQWPAGGHSVPEWKQKCRGRMAMWGGGVNSQATLPLGSVRDVEDETRRNVRILSEDGGYVFCNIHNILAEIAPEKVIAMCRAAAEA